MIVFDLRCTAGHVFEAWFGSSDAFATQRAAGQIGCPVCGDTAIEKAVMAPNIPAKANGRADTPAPPAAVKDAMRQFAEMQGAMLAKSSWVGTDFATRARAMHLGEEPTALIHGQASVTEARALVEDGVPVAPLPFPVVPPDATH